MKTINLLDTIKQDIKYFNTIDNFTPVYLWIGEEKSTDKNCQKWYILYNGDTVICNGPLEEINIAVKSLIKYKESL